MSVGGADRSNLGRLELGWAHRHMWHVTCPLGDWGLDLELRGTVSRVGKRHLKNGTEGQ